MSTGKIVKDGKSVMKYYVLQECILFKLKAENYLGIRGHLIFKLISSSNQFDFAHTEIFNDYSRLDSVLGWPYSKFGRFSKGFLDFCMRFFDIPLF